MKSSGSKGGGGAAGSKDGDGAEGELAEKEKDNQEGEGSDDEETGEEAKVKPFEDDPVPTGGWSYRASAFSPERRPAKHVKWCHAFVRGGFYPTFHAKMDLELNQAKGKKTGRGKKAGEGEGEKEKEKWVEFLSPELSVYFVLCCIVKVTGGKVETTPHFGKVCGGAARL